MAMVISRKYEVVGQLGRGGMGVVYKVRHSALDTILALKVLPAYLTDNQEMLARFYREARVMARLRHHNIVRVLDIDQDDTLNFHYFVMEYLQGKTLGEYLRERGPLPLPDVLEIARQVASALEYAHSHNPPVIHRDIKPSNIMIEDLSGRSVVMDFGIAKELGESEMTKSGVMIGTVKYCSQEQMRHEPLDGGADVYSLGMVIYEAYTGMQFFAGLDEHTVISRVLDDTRENEPHFTRPAPPAFAALVTKAIAKARSKRYRTMADLLRDLDECRSALEETKTVLLPMPGGGKSPVEEAQDSVEDLEEQIRKLEEERQRRLVSSLRTQVREAGERAGREGAAERASALFQQGLALEEQANEHFRHNNYPLAQASYQDAASLFNQAREEAQRVAGVQKAEQARQALATAKAEAEHYGAREKARTFYGRGLALQARADERWEKKDYQQAGQEYTAARKFFEDARELAYRETFREEAETIKAGLITAKNAAIAAEAAEFAAAVFQEAVLNEQRANTAMEQEEFTQARELYRSAHQKYGLAQEQARLERQRQQALAAQQRARETRQWAETRGIRQFSFSSYQRAAEAQQQGDARFEAHEYERAVLAYEQACEVYTQGGQEAEEAQRQQAAARVRRQQELAETACQSARQAREAARALALWAQDLWREAQRLADEADQAWKAQDYMHAGECAEAARQRYEQVRSEGEHERLRLQALAFSAYQRMERARAEAEQGGASARLATDFAQVQHVVEQGQVRAEREEFAEACAFYEQAAQDFARLQQQAELQTAQEAAEQARRRLLEQQETLRPLRAWATTAWEQADQEAGRAEAAWQLQAYQPATELYTQALQAYARAREQAEIEQGTQHALNAQRGMVAVQEEADRVQAPQYAPARYQQAAALRQQAEQKREERAYEQAALLFAQVQELLRQAVDEARQEQARQAASAAHQRMEQARDRAERVGARTRFVVEFSQAQQVGEQGQTRAEQADFAGAGNCYEQAARIFVQLRREAVRQAAREDAEDARRRMEEVKERVTAQRQWTEPLWAQAQEWDTRAEQAYQAQEYERASGEYERARHLYEQAEEEAKREQLHRATLDLRQQAVIGKEEAEAAVAGQYAAELFAQGMAAYDEAGRRWQTHEWAEASLGYRAAQEFFTQATQAARREQARQAAAAAYQRMETAGTQAEEAGARVRLMAEFAQTQQLAEQGRACEEQQEFPQARELYSQAEQQFVALFQAAERQTAREHAETTHENVRQARESARALAPWAQDLWKEAQQIEAEAERAWQMQEYPRARERAEVARQYYEQVQRKGEHERLRLHALTAQQQGLQEQAGARAAEAEQYAAALYQQGVEAQRRGERHLTAQRWEAATEAFEQARGIFAQTLKNAQRCKGQQAADAARERALATRQDTDTYAELFPGRFEEAASFFLETEKAHGREDFPAAQEGFERCAALFQRLHADALLYRQREKAEYARGHAREQESTVLIAGGGRQKKQARKALLLGDRLFQQRQYTAAQARYEEAAALLAALHPAAQLQPEQTVMFPPSPAATLENISTGQRSVAALFSSPRVSLVLGSILMLTAGFSVVYLRRSVVAPDFQPQAEQPVRKIEKTVPRQSTPADQPPPAQPLDALAVLPHAPTTQSEERPVVLPPEQAATTTPVPVPPLPRLPLITRSTPQQEPGQELRVAEGQSLTFAVEAESPEHSPLRFAWLLDGVERGKDKRWTYKPDFDEGGPQAKAVKVIITDGENHAVEHAWRILVKDVDRPPKIIASSPSADALWVATGSVLDFSVEAVDPDKEDRLVYVWSLDGREVSRGQRWQFNVPAGAESRTRYRVTAEVADENNLHDRVAWNVNIKNTGAPPRIIDVQPRDEKLTVQVGQALDFFVTVDFPDDARTDKKSLRYRWNVEGDAPQATDTGRYHLVKTTPGTYRVTVLAISSEGLQSVPRRWNVEVQPLAVAVPSTVPALQLSEGEVRAWLEVYRQAWEGKDIDKLIQLGEISSQDAGKLRGLLSQYKDFHVLLQNVEIRRDGNQARVTFSRVDVLDGKSLPHPGQKIFTLEKDAQGRIARRP